jgi:hypothetical protein
MEQLTPQARSADRTAQLGANVYSVVHEIEHNRVKFHGTDFRVSQPGPATQESGTTARHASV